MDVELRFFATFREAVGQKTLGREFPDDATVGDVLDELVTEYDIDVYEDGDIRSQVSVMKNGKDVYHLDGADTELLDGDTLSVFPPVAGGGRVADSGGSEDGSGGGSGGAGGGGAVDAGGGGAGGARGG